MNRILCIVCGFALVVTATIVARAQPEERPPDQLVFEETEQLFARKDYSAVIARLARLWAEQGGGLPAPVAYWLGVSYHERGELSFAELLLLRAAREISEPATAFDALTRLAEISHRFGKPERAEEQLMQALFLAPTEADLLRVVLRVGELQQEHAPETALRTYGELIEAFPDAHAARLKRLRILFRLGRFEECLAVAAQDMPLVPVQERAEITYLMASGHQRLKNYAKAIELYDQLRQTFASSEFADDARYELAVCYFNNGQFQIAGQQAEAMLRGNPTREDHLRFLWLAADAQARMSQWQTAKQLYRDIAELTSDPAEAMRAVQAMIVIAKAQGQTAEVAELNRLLEENFASQPR